MLELTQKAEFFTETITELLALAKQEGASAAEACINAGTGISVNVRKQDVETIEQHQEQNLSVTLYFGQQKGSADTTDLSRASMVETIKAAAHIAQFTLPDSCAGLPEQEYLAKTWPDLDLYHPWSITPEEAIEFAKTMEAYALQLDPGITNSEGVSLSTYAGMNVYGCTRGFLATTSATQHEVSIGLIAGRDSEMQRDYSYTIARDPKDLWTYERVAQDAVLRTLRKMQPRKLKTGAVPVIFEASLAVGLFSSYLKAVSGGSLYRDSSFLLDSLGQQVFPKWCSLFEDPFVPKALGSSPFDAEGVQVKPQYLVEQGRVNTYLLSTYAARKLGLTPTGHAGGVHNVYLQTSAPSLSFTELVQKMDRGLIVTELMGQGVNLVTGDYSRGAAGLWVENGIIQYPVAEITIAGNLRDMFLNMVAISNDIETRGRIHSGSVLLERMMVAGH